jgi:hypothetical protein
MLLVMQSKFSLRLTNTTPWRRISCLIKYHAMKDDIKMYLNEIFCEAVDSIHLVRD